MEAKNKIYNTIVIGGGQAGLAVSFYLKQEGHEHLVFEKGQIGNSWISQRWDSFTLNTPNWMNTLPGLEINNKRDSFMNKNEFINYLKSYAARFSLPIKNDFEVVSLSQDKNENCFCIVTLHQGVLSEWKSNNVIVASGAMSKGSLPPLNKIIPDYITQLHASEYKNSIDLPEGDVIVVGSGQSGCQIAEELILSGRNVYLATSKVGRTPRRYKGKDLMEWLVLTGFMDIATSTVDATTINNPQPQVSGIGPLGHTISLQSLHRQGVLILGRLNGFENKTFTFNDDAIDNIHFADKSSEKIKKMIDDYILKNTISVKDNEFDDADAPDQESISASHLKSLPLSEYKINSIIWTTGFYSDFSWIKIPALDSSGKPIHENGISPVSGLYYIGFPWLSKRKSGIIFGIKEDAERIVSGIKN
ncbi:NAD(P)-binding domain-containing protein [Flavobacterium sp. F-65]|uniref:NAD(P)-binding domain-containing protein n=1 Tax=Flavobacterium pisciphilum TaxID=2893755 RepID=A0ABS8MR15_9FLAO|nr:NAD(P)-binding domain-containing protein [Flavobacterium sp. F-65]MCC9071199.1 NAD(P)-binding domain-containing protein [Flavobacterium sp. F-65]